MNKIIAILVFLGTLLFARQIISFGGESPLVKSRYISLAPSTTEVLFALGLDNEIVGVSFFCNFPQQAQRKEKVGNFSSPDIEKILFLKPDYIFCTGLEQIPAIAELRRLDLKVYVADPQNLEELFNTIIDIGKIVNKSEEAQSLIKNMRSTIKQVNSQVELIPENKKPKVFVEIWHEPLTTAGKGSFIDELITLAGGVNIASDTKRAYSIFSAEEVIKRNPDYIILAYMDREGPTKLVKERFGWKGISAVKNDHIYNDINPDMLLRPGPRVVDGLREIHKRLYP